jgi:class 3 adenylate cyclase/tetratricopeptide (TPR) repeat protein
VDIAAWLHDLGLQQYEEAFRVNAVDATVLPDLTADDLKDLGVSLVGHRRKLLAAIAALRNSALREAVADAISAERRQLTLMFCDLVGSTALSTQADPEDLSVLIGAYQRIAAEQVGRFGGYVAKYMGDGVLAYFGYPQAHEDDPVLAIQAGLAIVDAVSECAANAGSQQQVRIGIATGLVVVGELIGEGTAQERNVVGETPNLAARLQSLAEPGAIVIAETTHRLAGGLFEYRELGAISLKGFGKPVRAWQVTGTSAVESRFDARHAYGLTPLVGREEEIDLLRRRWHQAAGSEGRVVLIAGEPGIGKSRLVAALNEACSEEPHVRLLYYCSPYHTDSALHPFITQLERAAGFAREDTVETKLDKLEALFARAADADIALLAELLAVPGGDRHPTSEMTPQRKKELTLRAWMRQLEALAARLPVLMVVEDAHWLDPTSRELLDRIVEHIRCLPILLLITYRPEFQPPWVGQAHVTALALSRLAQRDGAAMVERVAGKALPNDLLGEIVARTDGVPLFVEELTQSVLESGLLYEQNGRWVLDNPLPPLAIPATLQASLIARLDRLSSVKEVAQTAAAIGRDFSHTLIAAVSPLAQGALDRALAQLVEAGLLFRSGEPPDATYVFKHALVQDAAYATLLRGPRQVLHLRIADALERHFPELAETQPEIVAHHFGEANKLDKAITYWHRAGEQSIAKSTLNEAVSQLRRSLDLLQHLPEDRDHKQQELEVLVPLATALRGAKGMAHPAVVLALDRARQLIAEIGAEGTALHFMVLRLQMGVYNVSGKPNMAVELGQELLSLPGGRTAWRPLITLAIALGLIGEYAKALPHLEAVIGSYEFEEARESALRTGLDNGVDSLCYLSWVFWHLGYPDRSMAAIDRALTLGRKLAHPDTLVYAFETVAETVCFGRQFQLVEEYAKSSIAIANQYEFVQYPGVCNVMLGWVLAQTGDAGAGADQIYQGLEAARATGSRYFEPLFLGMLAEALSLAGRAEEGLAAIAEGFEISALGQVFADPELHRLRGDLLWRMPSSDLPAVEACYREALVIARRHGSRGFELRAATSLARLWRHQGKGAEARVLLAPVYGWFTEGFDTADLKEAKGLLDELT